MLKKISIKLLYPLALAEGEGVGTAYEYYAKRLLLSRWLVKKDRPQRILIAGLPQKYGASMDFLQLAAELDADLTIVDNREPAIGRCKSALEKIQQNGNMTRLDPTFILTQDLTTVPEIKGNFDLALSSEVLQRLPADTQLDYICNTLQMASHLALFMPNGDNPAHTNISGLTGLKLSELERLSDQAMESAHTSGASNSPPRGYIDMPPFPPGLTRTDDQREHASTGAGEAAAMLGLAYYAHMEQWFPQSWRRTKSHIVYAFLDNSQR